MITKIVTIDSHSYTVHYPDKCPVCHHYGDIPTVYTFVYKGPGGVRMVFQCPFAGCREVFIGYYGPRGEKPLLALRPQEPELEGFHDVISRMSPQFVSIFEEAAKARHASLDQIAGPGYRKAFEFLIKDYAKDLYPDKEEQIKRTFAGNVVSEYIADSRIQGVAKRALWLGNDETHYLRVWEEQDIDDLIRLIMLTINWIEIEKLSEDYTEKMPDQEE